MAEIVLSESESIDRGKQARKSVPRKLLASVSPRPDGFDPIAVLEAQAKTRVQNLVPIRYQRMSESPFAFYRGGAAIMASDLAQSPQTSISVQLCGDAHLSNFGIFASPERNLVFDLNDFDETLPGPWEWDVKRLCASLVIAAQSNGFSLDDQLEVAVRAARSYRQAMFTNAEMSALDVWYSKFNIDEFIQTNARKVSEAERTRMLKNRDKAQSRNSAQAFSKLTEEVDGQPRFLNAPPLLVPIFQMLSESQAQLVWDIISKTMAEYARSLPPDRRHLLNQYQMVDLAHKVVGVGSVGTRAWVILMMGHEGDDPLLLQVKQAEPSVLEKHLRKSATDNHGQRVVYGQRIMQTVSDIFLGWTKVQAPDGTHIDYYVRQLRDGKFSAQVELMTPTTMGLYADACGWTLSRAHARSGDRVAIASYLGNGEQFEDALAKFSSHYAARNARDYEKLIAAIKSGRVVASDETS